MGTESTAGFLRTSLPQADAHTRSFSSFAPWATVQEAHPGQIALAWQLTKPFVSSVIVGATSREQLEQNLGAADLRPTAKQTRKLYVLTAPSVPYPAWMQPMFADAARGSSLEVTT